MSGQYRIINILEREVADVVEGILPTLSDTCGCDLCRADIICHTLNQLPPRYVIHRYGEILSRAEFQGTQRKAEIITAVMRAADKIRGKPHDDKPRLDHAPPPRPKA